MDGYSHYIRVDQAGTIVYGFSSAFEEPQSGDILIKEDGPRHFSQVWPESLKNERGQFRFKWEDEERVERSQTELDAEWSAQPPAPPTPEEEIAQLKNDNLTLMEAIAEIYEAMLGGAV